MFLKFICDNICKLKFRVNDIWLLRLCIFLFLHNRRIGFLCKSNIKTSPERIFPRTAIAYYFWYNLKLFPSVCIFVKRRIVTVFPFFFIKKIFSPIIEKNQNNHYSYNDEVVPKTHRSLICLNLKSRILPICIRKCCREIWILEFEFFCFF